MIPPNRFDYHYRDESDVAEKVGKESINSYYKIETLEKFIRKVGRLLVDGFFLAISSKSMMRFYLDTQEFDELH